MQADQVWEMGSTLTRLREILRSDFLVSPANRRSPFYNSVFIEALVHLNYLLITWKRQGSIPQIDFAEDIEPYECAEDSRRSYSDITGLVRYFRNAACHSDSSARMTKDGSMQ